MSHAPRPAAVIETARLRLVPLTAAEMRLFATDWPALLRALGLSPAPEWSDAGARAGALRHAGEMDRDPASWLWWTFWQVVLKHTPVPAPSAGPWPGYQPIGVVDFKGPPDAAGVVGIGYGLAEAYRRQGYGTEAVGALVDWAFARPVGPPVPPVGLLGPGPGAVAAGGHEPSSSIRAITADIARSNMASQRLAAGLGFRLSHEVAGGMAKYGVSEDALIWRRDRSPGRGG